MLTNIGGMSLLVIIVVMNFSSFTSNPAMPVFIELELAAHAYREIRLGHACEA